MNKRPQFSIITICFNSSATIERTIKSVLAQTLTDYEYIIVDGGSTDSTLDIVKKYEPLFEGRMKWKSEHDKGIYDAMNKGIERSLGVIIGIVNSDDWLEVDALKDVYDSFVSNEKRTDCLYCGGMYFHSKYGNVIKLRTNADALNKYARIGQIGGVRHPATFVPKDIYTKYGTFDARMKISADEDFLFRIYRNLQEKGFILIDKYLTNMSDGGASNVLSLCYLFNNIIPDWNIQLCNWNIPKYKKKYYLFIWTMKTLVKLIFCKIGLYKVR